MKTVLGRMDFLISCITFVPKRGILMAKPIKNTPVLKGKDLIAFHAELEKSESISTSEKETERDRVAKNAERLMRLFSAIS